MQRARWNRRAAVNYMALGKAGEASQFAQQARIHRELAAEKSAPHLATDNEAGEPDEPLALADIESMQQPEWEEGRTAGEDSPRVLQKYVDLGRHLNGMPDKLHIYAVEQHDSNPERCSNPRTWTDGSGTFRLFANTPGNRRTHP